MGMTARLRHRSRFGFSFVVALFCALSPDNSDASERTFHVLLLKTNSEISVDSAARQYGRAKLLDSSPLDQTNPLRIAMLSGIRLYQILFSSQNGPKCQFRPTCSHFGAQSIKEYGPIEGLLMTSDRILRCHPWAEGAYPVSSDGVHYEDSLAAHAMWGGRCDGQ